jgi:hypothetical protein
MQQRRLRLGDILDDYCPRERRITNHAVVAMIDDEVKQTRCTTCDADHDYKEAKRPPPRRRKSDASVDSPEGALLARPESETPIPPEDAPDGEAPEAQPLDASLPAEPPSPDADPVAAAGAEDDDGPVHRRLIRATLPRQVGQTPERKMPDFTVRQPGHGGRPFDGNKNGNRQGQRPSTGQSSQFGGSRHGSGSGHRPAGNRSGQAGGGQRGGGPNPGHGQGRAGGRRRGR